MDVISIISYICIGICIIGMIVKLWSNINVSILNKKATKIFYYFSMSLLCMGCSDIDKLFVGELFRRYHSNKSTIGYITKDMCMAFFGRYRQADGFIYLEKLYYSPTPQVLDMITKDNGIITEDMLINNMTLYLALNEDTKKVEFFCGPYKLDDLKFQNSITSMRLLKGVINTIYRECSMKKDSLSPICIDFAMYYKILTKEEDSGN